MRSCRFLPAEFHAQRTYPANSTWVTAGDMIIRRDWISNFCISALQTVSFKNCSFGAGGTTGFRRQNCHHGTHFVQLWGLSRPYCPHVPINAEKKGVIQAEVATCERPGSVEGDIPGT